MKRLMKAADDEKVFETINLCHLERDPDSRLPGTFRAIQPVRRSRQNGGTKLCGDLLSLQAGGYWDDAKGGWLNPDVVKAACTEEMGYVRKHTVYRRVPRAQCWAETGRAPIKTGWADTNKGSAESPNIRSRWVAKEFHTHDRPELFTPTSPREGVKLVISHSASTGTRDSTLMVIEIRRAYFYAPASRKVYIELPAEDRLPGEEGMVAQLIPDMALGVRP